MKFIDKDLPDLTDHVTPLAGVWIEMLAPAHRYPLPGVTPLAGVWIEIS